MTASAAVSKYYWIARTSAKSNLAYLSEVASRIVFLTIILYIFLRLWQVTYGETHSTVLGGLTLTQMLWYLVMTESIILSTPRIAPVVDADVRSGSIAVHFIRPLSYPLYCFFNTLGERLVRFFLNLCVGSVIATVMVGLLPLKPASIACFLSVLPLAFIIDFCGYFLVGMAAFWIEDTNGLTLIYSRMTMILGGMLIPLELFPPGWQPVLKALPFSSVIYGPARLFVDPTSALYVDVLLHQIIACCIFAGAVWFVFRLASSRVFANGG
jgi:ABC-2 type transport system permease protein